MSKKCFVGIDGGGTKSIICAIDENGSILYKGYGGTTNIASSSLDTVYENILELFTKLKNNLPEIEILSVAIGTAGISLLDVKKNIENILFSITKCKCITVTSDIDILLNLYKGENRVFLISGTGSICYSCNENNEKFRTGGYGHIFSDEGSGYSIACKILNAIMQAKDGRSHNTILTQLFLDKANISSDDELVNFIYSKNFDKKFIAGFGAIIDEAVVLGDTTAIDICNKTCDELYSLFKNCIDKINNENKVHLVLCGSVLTKNLFIRNLLIDKIKANYNNVLICEEEVSPYILACEMGKNIYERYWCNN
ncbi:MAG: BadF/BadG/BcrA/BcrD ATPase family protein [Lachnospirales bacterium]